MAQLKIALCITDLDVGGAERALVQLATRLDRHRFDPAVYCLGPRPEREEASCVPALEEAGIEVHCLGARRSSQFLPVIRRLRRLLEKRPADLVQSFLFHANMVSRLAARGVGLRPVVCGIRVAEPRQWHLWTDRHTSSLVDRYVCVSESVARFSADVARLPPEKLTVIPNAVDTAKFPAPRAAERAGLGLPPGRRMVTYVGRLEEQKGVRWLVDSADDWLGRMPNCDLVLVGDGPDRPKLEQLCQDRESSKGRIHFLGWRSDVAEILAGSELLVLPSRWEGMPNVVLEAMASRLPVVATDAEGVRELLGQEAEEQTVPYGDSDALAERILQLASDRELAAELGQRNRTRVEREFTFRRVVDAYQDLWTTLVES